MKHLQSAMLILLLLNPSAPCLAGGIPRAIAGFVLGSRLEDNRDRLRMESAMPVRYMECISEIETRPLAGFKTGLVYVGNCSGDARIVRIKLKYADASEDYYKALLERYTRRLGKPGEWKGDPFHAVQAWKWTFTDKDGTAVSIILQHNATEMDEKIGNSVKITLTPLMEAEEAAYRKNRDKYRVPLPVETNEKPAGQADWEWLLPK